MTPLNFKTCTGCKNEFPKSEFLYLGNGARHSRCHPCRKEYQRNYYKKQKQMERKLW